MQVKTGDREFDDLPKHFKTRHHKTQTICVTTTAFNFVLLQPFLSALKHQISLSLKQQTISTPFQHSHMYAGQQWQPWLHLQLNISILISKPLSRRRSYFNQQQHIENKPAAGSSAPSATSSSAGDSRSEGRKRATLLVICCCCCCWQPMAPKGGGHVTFATSFACSSLFSPRNHHQLLLRLLSSMTNLFTATRPTTAAVKFLAEFSPVSFSNCA